MSSPGDNGTCVALVAVLLFLPVLSACAPRAVHQAGRDAGESSATVAFAQVRPSPLQESASQYLLAPGDRIDVVFQLGRRPVERLPITLDHILEVRFIELPELTTTQQVQPTGRIVLPYLGEVPVLDKTTEEIAVELRERYRKTLIDPQLMVRVVNVDVHLEQLRESLRHGPRGLSRLLLVRPGGHADFPLIGDQRVVGLTVSQAQELLRRSYQEYLAGLHVDLYLHEPVGSVVHVLGEVRQPGPYAILKPIAVQDALALAQGHSGNARLDSVVLFRRYPQGIIARLINLHDAQEAKQAGVVGMLRPDDVVFVPGGSIADMADLMRQIGDVVSCRGWGDERDDISIHFNR